MDVNDDEGCLITRGAHATIASRLAPTEAPDEEEGEAGDEVQEPDRPITVFKVRQKVTGQENQGLAPV